MIFLHLSKVAEEGRRASELLAQRQAECDHTRAFKDTEGFIYDIRTCLLCGSTSHV